MVVGSWTRLCTRVAQIRSGMLARPKLGNQKAGARHEVLQTEVDKICSKRNSCGRVVMNYLYACYSTDRPVRVSEAVALSGASRSSVCDVLASFREIGAVVNDGTNRLSQDQIDNFEDIVPHTILSDPTVREFVRLASMYYAIHDVNEIQDASKRREQPVWLDEKSLNVGMDRYFKEVIAPKYGPS